MGCICSKDIEPLQRQPTPERQKWQKTLAEKEVAVLKCPILKCPITNGKLTENDELDSGQSSLLRQLSSLDEHDHEALTINPRDYVDDFPFENLVFEGGGNKGLAYVGAVQYLEELGLLPKIKRYAGASAGAMTAALLASGYTSEDIANFLSENIEDIFLDHSCGYLSLIPNLIRAFGWNPGKKIFRWFGDKLKIVNGDPDVTFCELYKTRKVELCVVVTNLSQMSTEYCHLKTTPDMPIREAIRMSMAIPGIFAARRYDNHGQKDVYVDGGVLCNYPIHSFDGWYLSLKEEDAFLKKMYPLSELPTLMAPANRFGSKNNKSLGFLIYEDTETEVMRYSLEKRCGVLEPAKPTENTKLYQLKQKTKEIHLRAEKEHSRVVKAVESFTKALHKHNHSEKEYIDKEELIDAMKDPLFTQEQAELLFPGNVSGELAFEILDRDGNGKIAFVELVQFIEEHGIRMQTRFQGFGREEVKDLPSFLSALQRTMLTNMKYIYVQQEDIDRTVGINTGHIGTADYTLEKADRDFVIRRGYNSMKAYLQYYVVKNKHKMNKTTETEVLKNNHLATCDDVLLEEAEGKEAGKSLLSNPER